MSEITKFETASSTSTPLNSIPLAPIPLAPIPLAPIPLAPIPLAPIPLAPIPLAPIPLTPSLILSPHTKSAHTSSKKPTTAKSAKSNRLPISKQMKISSTPKSGQTNIQSKSKQIKNKNKTPPPRCSARTASGAQCRKSAKIDIDYCGCHHQKRPFGRFDGPLEGKFLNQPKKKGRKFREAKEWSLEDLDLDLYVATQLILVDGQKYLLDQQDLLYSNDSQCQIVGRTQGDLIHWYV